jgi:ABC-2 type transport system ATP-binding protein
MSDAIVIEDLVKDYGDKRVVDHVSLRIGRGEFFGFVGPNGAGKTTTIKMIAGLLKPTAGRIVVAGHPVAEEPLAAKAALGLLSEEPNLYERLKGREFLEFAGGMYGLPAEEVSRRSGELLRLMELGDEAEALIADYSQGMRKKVALAAALIHNPQVLLLDEAFTGIDPISTRAIQRVLTRLQERGTTIFFSSHVLDVVERLCTRLAILHHGRIVAEGTVPEVVAAAQAGEDAALEDAFLRLVGAPEQESDLSWIG